MVWLEFYILINISIYLIQYFYLLLNFILSNNLFLKFIHIINFIDRMIY
jgi:hypothetical protein